MEERPPTLLVWRDRPIAKLVEINLRAGGHNLPFASAEDAIAEAERLRPPTVALVGFAPEEADGLRRRLKEHPPTCHIPVLLLRDWQATKRFLRTLGLG